MSIRLDRKVKTTEVEIVKFWNDTHNLTMIFEPIIELEPEIPTNIKVSVSDVMPITLTEIKLSL